MTLDEYKKEVWDIVRTSREQCGFDMMFHPRAQIVDGGDESDESVVTVTFVVRHDGLREVAKRALNDLSSFQYVELLNYSDQKVSDMTMAQ